MPLKLNGVEVERVVVNGVECDSVWCNGIQVIIPPIEIGTGSNSGAACKYTYNSANGQSSITVTNSTDTIANFDTKIAVSWMDSIFVGNGYAHKFLDIDIEGTETILRKVILNNSDSNRYPNAMSAVITSSDKCSANYTVSVEEGGEKISDIYSYLSIIGINNANYFEVQCRISNAHERYLSESRMAVQKGDVLLSVVENNIFAFGPSTATIKYHGIIANDPLLSSKYFCIRMHEVTESGIISLADPHPSKYTLILAGKR